MKYPTLRRYAVNICGTFGYLTCLMQWFWIGILLLPSLLANNQIHEFLLPKNQPNQQTPHIVIDSSSVLFTIIAIAITVVVLGVTILVIVRLPSTVAKTSKHAVDTAAESLLPVITHHKKLPEIKQRRLTFRIKIAIKGATCLVPVALLAVVYFVDVQLSRNIAIGVGIFLALSSFVWFGFEYFLAKTLGISEKDII